MVVVFSPDLRIWLIDFWWNWNDEFFKGKKIGYFFYEDEEGRRWQ